MTVGGAMSVAGILAVKWNNLLADSQRRVTPEMLPFPTDAQLDLLKAALLPAHQAQPAWKRWKDRGLKLETVGDASFRIFPRLWANREAAAIDPEDTALLKGVYRQSFADNVAKLSAALEAARILGDAGIPVLFFKGAALIALCDTNLGLRRIADVDILIPEPDAERAAAVLSAAGYQAPYGPPDVGWFHSWTCRTPEGHEIDVHWSAFKPPGDDNRMFDTARQATLLGRTVLVPSVTECLLVAIGNAFWFDGPPMRWIADSLLLFQTGVIDWDVVRRRADRPGVLPGLTAALEFLAREFGAPVPAVVIEDLRRRPISWQERAAYWVATRCPLPELRFVGQLERRRAHRLRYSSSSPQYRPVLKTARTVLRLVALLVMRFVHAVAVGLHGLHARRLARKIGSDLK